MLPTKTVRALVGSWRWRLSVVIAVRLTAPPVLLSEDVQAAGTHGNSPSQKVEWVYVFAVKTTSTMVWNVVVSVAFSLLSTMKYCQKMRATSARLDAAVASTDAFSARLTLQESYTMSQICEDSRCSSVLAAHRLNNLNKERVYVQVGAPARAAQY